MEKYKMLSLDISTTGTGWCLWENGKYKMSGVLKQNIKNKEKVDIVSGMIRMLLNLLDDTTPQHIAIEDTYSSSGFNSSRMLDRLHGAVIAWATMHEAYLDYIYISEWRKFLNWPSATALKKQGIRSPSHWYKKQSIERIQKLYDASITDDNEADAVNIGEAVMIRFDRNAQNA